MKMEEFTEKEIRLKAIDKFVFYKEALIWW